MIRWPWTWRRPQGRSAPHRPTSFRDEVLKAQLVTVIPLALAVATLAATAVLVQYLALRWQPINLVDELAVADLQVVLSAAPPEQMPVLASWIAEFGLHMQPDSTADAAGDRAVRLSDGRRVALSTVVSWLDSGKRIDPVTQRALGPVPSAWQAALPAPSDTSTINSVAAEAALPEMEEGRWKTLLLPLSSGRFVAISSPDFSLSAQHVASAGAVVFAIAFVGTGIVVVLFFWTFRGRFAARSAERLSAPLERLAEAVRNATRTARFTSPVSVNDKSPRELVELARDFNALQAMVSEALADRETVIGHQRRLVAELAHELRTPLTVILGHAEVLSRTAASAKAADVIQRQARDLHLLVSDLLDAAQVESIEATLEADKVDLVSLAQEMIQRFSMPGRRHGVSVCLESAPSSGDALVTADARWLRQVVANVVTHAIRFTPEGGVVALSIYPLQGRYALQVENSGSEVENVSVAADPAGRGAGLGLKVATRLIEAMGGTLRLDTASLGGTAIELSLARVEGAETSSPEQPRAS